MSTPSIIEAAGQAAAAALAQRVEADVGQLRKALRQLSDLSGMSRRAVEQCLLGTRCGVDVTRLLAGRFDLKVKHVLAICRVIELEPLELLELALRPRPGQRSPLFRNLQGLFAAARPEPNPPTPGPPDAATLMQRVQALQDQLEELKQQAARVASPAAGAGAGVPDSHQRALPAPAGGFFSRARECGPKAPPTAGREPTAVPSRPPCAPPLKPGGQHGSQAAGRLSQTRPTRATCPHSRGIAAACRTAAGLGRPSMTFTSPSTCLPSNPSACPRRPLPRHG